MSEACAFRSEAQSKRVAAAEASGYVHHRDSVYKIKQGRSSPTLVGCLVVLFGDVIGHERAMVVYPDGSVVTQEPKRGGSRTVTFDRERMARALLQHGKVIA